MNAQPDSRVAIIGLGYVGLPLALSFIEAGLEVVGVDASQPRVDELLTGRSPIDDIGDTQLRAALGRGFRVVHTSQVDLAAVDVIFVCVPTPINEAKDPDLGPVLAAARLVREQLRARQLVVLQSTTFPGTTSGPFREELERSDLVAGRDFDLAFAPERVNPGDPASHRRDVPRLVGGFTPAGTARAATLQRRINSAVYELSSPDAAELAKLLENVFRNVNIALVNQLAPLCERMGSTSGRSSMRPPPNRSASCLSGRVRASAATASRWTPTTSAGGPANSISSTGSWKSPATSTWQCPAMSWTS